MCRLLIGVFSSGVVCGELLPTLLGVLCEVARCDPFLSGRCHGDGWGLAVVVGSELVIYRSGRAIWCDSVFSEVVESLPRFLRYWSSPVYLLAHVRRRGSRQPAGSLYAHPYVYGCCRGVVALIHNGSVDKGCLVRDLGLDPSVESYVTDSEVLGLLLCRCLESRSDVVSAVRDFVAASLKYVKTALNLGIVIHGGGTKVFAVHYVNRDTCSREERVRYYRLYSLRYRGGLVVVSSSFLEKEPRLRDSAEVRELEEGVYMYSVESGEVSEFYWGIG
ncbi:MAG: hypothetical protein DRJ40_06300 [Thermoprotei archaeon]|nr:MAG: hypothetical protein DRJ40_06300 [Thermoprotei archaeon]